MNNLKAKVICAGNCPVCNKPLKDDECIFICNECKIKNEIFMELEKIKAEMIKNFWNGDLDEMQEAFNQGVSKSILILDNYIKELKGENNE